jgi:hypothetical protein
MKREFHHMGMPSTRQRSDEIYLESLKIFITDPGKSANRIEWVRALPDCPFPEVMKTKAHIAYVVENLAESIKGQTVIWPPCEPLPGIRVAFVLEEEAPVEYLEIKA